MNAIEIGKRIKYARTLRQLTLDDIANTIGVARSTVQRYETGKIHKLKIPVLDSIAQALDVNPAWLCLKSDEMYISKPNSTAVKIPVIGKVAAGIPIDAIQEIIDTEEITQELASTGDFFGLQIKGDSMTPRICEGDVVIVKQQSDAESGDTVIATVNGDEATCKRLRKYKEGIELIPNNPTYEPLYFSNEEIDAKPVRILGKVIELRGKF